MKRLLPLFVLLSALARPAEAMLDFSDFPGTYKGKYQLVADTTVIAGNLEARVMTNKSGKALTVEIFGPIALTGTPGFIASYSLLKLKSNRKVTSLSSLIGYYQLLPVAAKFAGRKNRFTFVLSSVALPPSTMT